MASTVTAQTAPVDPKGLRLSTISGKGRGFIATQGFKAGDVLIRDVAMRAESHVAAARCLLSDARYTWLKENLHCAPVSVIPPRPTDLQKSVSEAGWKKAFRQVECNAWVLDDGVVLFGHLSFFNCVCMQRDRRRSRSMCVIYLHSSIRPHTFPSRNVEKWLELRLSLCSLR